MGVLVGGAARLERRARKPLSPPIVHEVPGLAGPLQVQPCQPGAICRTDWVSGHAPHVERDVRVRSEEHTSELQSQSNLVCRLLLEKKKKKKCTQKHTMYATSI